MSIKSLNLRHMYARPTPRHCPPSTLIGRTVHRSSTDPVSLHPSRVVEKNEQPRRVQATKALSVCVEALKRQDSKVQPVKTAPRLVASVRSTSRKVQSVKRASARSAAYQSAPVKVRPSSMRPARSLLSGTDLSAGRAHRGRR